VEFPDRRQELRRPLHLRLTPEEDALIDLLAARMGGETKTRVIEEALILYLPTVAKAEAMIKRVIPLAKERRNYRIRSDVHSYLYEVCRDHGWQMNEVVRHALIEFGNVLKSKN
jgi:hypothetical protein